MTWWWVLNGLLWWLAVNVLYVWWVVRRHGRKSRR